MLCLHIDWQSVKVFLQSRQSGLLDIIYKILKLDPLKAVKTFKGMQYGQYCTISGTEPHQ